MGKVHLGLGDYGRKTPVGLGYHGQNPLGFGLPWAKVTWVWAIMGTNAAGLGYHGLKVDLGLGYYGHGRL